MRFTHYLRKLLVTGSVERLPFDESHFREVGMSTMSGMPILEAYQLVNKWNVDQNSQRFMFALEP
jgi:hypothetical protein